MYAPTFSVDQILQDVVKGLRKFCLELKILCELRRNIYLNKNILFTQLTFSDFFYYLWKLELMRNDSFLPIACSVTSL